MNRRSFTKKALIGAGLGLAAATGIGRIAETSFSSAYSYSGSLPDSFSSTVHSKISTPEEALHRLAEGNARFASGKAIHPDQSPERRKELVEEQHPWASILGCIDSRAPPELLFDVGLGEIFVARSAGAGS